MKIAVPLSSPRPPDGRRDDDHAVLSVTVNAPLAAVAAPVVVQNYRAIMAKNSPDRSGSEADGGTLPLQTQNGQDSGPAMACFCCQIGN